MRERSERIVALLKLPFECDDLASSGVCSGSGGHGQAKVSFGPAMIDDDTPTPEHARFTWGRVLTVLLWGLSLWAIPMAFFTLSLGWDHTLTQMGWFFTKAALLTFGGAYAVLPYVYQGAVEFFGWLSPAQMIDGLALGETTPGPLIIVVAYVGFVGGYLKQLFGPEALFLAGTAGALVVTWFTFLPSFLFILGGGPFIESTHNNLKLSAPLTAITAAVVGVILNLALFFAYHVWWPNGLSSSLDWASAVLTIGACVALIAFKRNVVPVILTSGLLGLVLKTAM